MKGTKIIIWSLIFTAVLGLNSFAADMAKEIKSSSKEISTDLKETLQTAKETKELESDEVEGFFDNDPIYVGIQSPLITFDSRKQTYIAKHPKSYRDGHSCKIRKTDKKITAISDSFMKWEVEILVKSPAIDNKTGKPIPNSVSFTMSKSVFNSNPVKFSLYEIYRSPEFGNPSELRIQYDLGDGKDVRINVLAEEDCTFIDRTPEYIKHI